MPSRLSMRPLGLLAVAWVAACAGADDENWAGTRSHDNAMKAMEEGLGGGLPETLKEGIAAHHLVNKLNREGGDRSYVAMSGNTGVSSGAAGLFGFNPSGFTVKQESSGELLDALKVESRQHEETQAEHEFKANKEEVEADLTDIQSTRVGPSSGGKPSLASAQQQLLKEMSGWGYQGLLGPTDWGKVSPECANGKHQSPINIESALAVPIASDISSIALLDWRSSPLEAERQKLSADVGNDAHQRIYLSLPVNSRFASGGRSRNLLEAVPGEGDAGRHSVEETYEGHSFEVDHLGTHTLFIDGGTYTLQRIATKTPGEHMIDGKPADLEIQFLHVPFGADSHRYKAVGVSVLFSTAKGGTSPAFVTKLAGVAPDATRVSRTLVDGLTFDEIAGAVSESLKDYFRYSGSLTTPPCTEGVAWFVATKPLGVAAKDTARLRLAEGHNNRPPQPLNGRKVQYIA